VGTIGFEIARCGDGALWERGGEDPKTEEMREDVAVGGRGGSSVAVRMLWFEMERI
jgi:hypothetical protein